MRSARSVVSERTSRITQGAKITPRTTTATSTESSTSRAALSAPVVCRKTTPAASTSAMPRPVREIDAAVRPGLDLWGCADAAAGARLGGAAASVTAEAGSPPRAPRTRAR